MRVCYFGTYRSDYTRNRIMIEGLRRVGLEVVECHAPLWKGIEDRVEAASGGWIRPTFVWRVFRSYVTLLARYRQLGHYDVMVVGYPGLFDVYPARLLTWLRRRPLVWDIFMSIYLVALERGLADRSPLTMWGIQQLERTACQLPDLLVIDTPEYVDWFQQACGARPEQFRLVPTGADDQIFRPVSGECVGEDGFHVVYYGTFIRNHGVEHIVEAGRLLRHDAGIQIELIGQGPERGRALALARRHKLSNVSFVDWLDREQLVQHVASADVCLGAFGVTPQSLMTIQNKIYEAMAMGKAIITGDSPAVRRSMVHGEHLYVCERANPQALADAVRALKADSSLRLHLAENALRLYRDQYDLQHNGARFAACLQELLGDRCSEGGQF